MAIYLRGTLNLGPVYLLWLLGHKLDLDATLWKSDLYREKTWIRLEPFKNCIRIKPHEKNRICIQLIEKKLEKNKSTVKQDPAIKKIVSGSD